MNNLKFSKKHKLLLYAIIAMIIIVINFLVSYKYSIKNIDSDATSELILGKILAEEGGICSENWMYSTELRVLNIQLLYKLFFGVTSNWALVRALAFAVLLLVLFVVYISVVMKYDLGDGAAILGLVLLLPFSHQYSKFVLFNQYYFPHIIITLSTLLLLVLDSNSGMKRWKQGLLLGVNFLLAVFAGMGGMRQMIVLYLPLFVAAGIVFVIKWRLGNDWKIWGHVLIQTLLLLVGSILGYFVNSKILNKYYKFSDYSKLQFESFSMEKLEWFINSYFSFWGYEKEIEILSVDGIINLCGLSLGLLFPLAVYIIIRTWKNCDFKEQIIIAFFLTNIVCHICIFMFSNIGQRERYLLPVFFLAIPVLAISCRHLPDLFLKRAFLLLFIMLLGLSSLRGYKEYCANTKNDSKIELVQFLQENDYNFGYATFWNASVLTEMTNGEVEMYPMPSRNKTADIWNELRSTYWLVSYDILNKQTEDPVFILFTKKEKKKYGTGVFYLDDKDCIFRNKDYYVYAYPSQKALMDLVEQK